MNRDDSIRMAGHREVPPWVMKLVIDCVEAEREACAQEAEGIAIAVHGYDKYGYAEAIRARNEKTQLL